MAILREYNFYAFYIYRPLRAFSLDKRPFVKRDDCGHGAHFVYWAMKHCKRPPELLFSSENKVLSFF